MYYFNLAAIHKQESPFLKEWIDYHLLVGVEHFYLGCNDDDDSEVLSILKPYKDVVTHVHIPGNAKMYEFYNMIIQTASSKWVGFIDADEFILPINTQTVSELLPKYEQFGAVTVNWRLYGSKFDTNPKSQINELLYRWEADGHVKSIVQPKFVINFGSPHHCNYKDNFAVNEKFDMVNGPFCRPPVGDDMVINHYYCRSKDWFFNVKNKRGKPEIGPGSYYTEEFFNWVNRDSIIFDDLISKKYGKNIF